MPKHTERARDAPSVWTTAGARDARRWLDARGLEAPANKRWFVEMALDVVDRPASLTYSSDTDTRFHFNVYPEEWGIFFCCGSRASWIRVTDEPFVHGRDDHRLLHDLPSIGHVDALVRSLEHRFRIAFRREHALVRSNIAGALGAVREWLTA